MNLCQAEIERGTNLENYVPHYICKETVAHELINTAWGLWTLNEIFDTWGDVMGLNSSYLFLM